MTISRPTRRTRPTRHVEPASGPDPAINAARALTTCMAAFRDLLNDDGYAAVLPAFEALRTAIPEAPDVPPPRARPYSADRHPLNRGTA